MGTTTRGIELKTLAAGTRRRVGGAVFEITKSCTPGDFIDDIRRAAQSWKVSAGCWRA